MYRSTTSGSSVVAEALPMLLRVDKIKRGAEIFLLDGSHLVGSFFLSPLSPCHTGGELIAELLTGDALFLPFQLADGEMVFIQRDFIAMVLLEQKEVNEDLPFLKTAGVIVSLLSGETLEGNVFLDLPENRCRLSDFFNECKGFFYLEVGETQYLINARCVKLVRPTPAS
jgi:hypothetical protein